MLFLRGTDKKLLPIVLVGSVQEKHSSSVLFLLPWTSRLNGNINPWCPVTRFVSASINGSDLLGA